MNGSSDMGLDDWRVRGGWRGNEGFVSQSESDEMIGDGGVGRQWQQEGYIMLPGYNVKTPNHRFYDNDAGNASMSVHKRKAKEQVDYGEPLTLSSHNASLSRRRSMSGSDDRGLEDMRVRDCWREDDELRFLTEEKWVDGGGQQSMASGNNVKSPSQRYDDSRQSPPLNDRDIMGQIEFGVEKQCERLEGSPEANTAAATSSTTASLPMPDITNSYTSSSRRTKKAKTAVKIPTPPPRRNAAAIASPVVVSGADDFDDW